MRIYWAARPTMHLCQLAQYADTFFQLGGNKPSSVTTSQVSLISRDRQRNRPRDRAHSRNVGCRNKTNAFVLQLKVHPADREKSPDIGTQQVA